MKISENKYVQYTAVAASVAAISTAAYFGIKYVVASEVGKTISSKCKNCVNSLTASSASQANASASNDSTDATTTTSSSSQ